MAASSQRAATVAVDSSGGSPLEAPALDDSTVAIRHDDRPARPGGDLADRGNVQVGALPDAPLVEASRFYRRLTVDADLDSLV